MTKEIDLREFSKTRRVTCKVPDLPLDEEKRAKLDAAFETMSISTNAIYNRLSSTEWNTPLAYNTVDKHRKKKCTCYKGEA